MLLPSTTILGQTDFIKNEIKELFFEIPVDASKFQVRKALNQYEVVSNVTEFEFPNTNTTSITADFTNNYKLGNISNANRMYVYFYFTKDEAEPFYRGLMFHFSAHNNYSKQQYNQLLSELIGFFKLKCKVKEKLLNAPNTVPKVQYSIYKTLTPSKNEEPIIQIESMTFDNEQLLSFGVEINNKW